MTWNAGGLPKDAWMEFQLWQHDEKDYDVIMIQETKRRFSSQFNFSEYHALHSGTADQRHQGCLRLIHKRCCKAEDVRWSPTLGGHLLYARFPHKQKHVDIVNLHQHCWNNASGIEQLTVKRVGHKLCSACTYLEYLDIGRRFQHALRIPRRLCGSRHHCKHPLPDQDQLQHMLMVLRLQILIS